MPRINLPPKKTYKDYPRYAKDNRKNNDNAKAVYNTRSWKLLRLEKLKEQPLCQICLSKDIIRSAVDVHHIIPISTGKSLLEKQSLGFDYFNLQSLCRDCHKEIHMFENK